MKILYVTTIGGTMNFFKTFIGNLVAEGHTVDIACNNTVSTPSEFYNEIGCKTYPISTSRSPLSKGNIKAIDQIKKLVEENGYDIVHCHTPLAAMCTRLACIKARKKGLKVIYTAHGFHFYKGAPLKNWMIYYPIEKICSYFTDVLININKEDYAFSQKKMKAKKIIYVPGVGIDLEKFGGITVDRVSKRKEIGIPEDATLVMSVGELNENKNHQAVIRAVASTENLYYIIAGKGRLKDTLQGMIDELGITDRIKLVGFRRDIGELCKSSDIFAFPSYREGLPVSVMEAMICGLPLVAARTRGVTDLIEDGKGGYLCSPSDSEAFAKRLKELAEDKKLREKMSEINKETIKGFGMEKVLEDMYSIYGLTKTKVKI